MYINQQEVDMRQTFKYKSAYIHVNYENKVETVTVQIFNGYDFYTVERKSFRAAQLFITKWFKPIK